MINIWLVISEIEDENERELVKHLFLTYSPRVKALALSILKDERDAEEALGDTFLKIIKYREKFFDIERDETKRLIVIYTRSVCFNMYNRKKKISFVSEDGCEKASSTPSQDTDEDVLAQLVNKECISKLKECIRSLGSPAEEIVLLKFYDNASNIKIAEMLGLNPSTVSTILQRSIQKLRKLMEEYINGED